MKSRNKIYNLARSFSETRVNDCNSVLLSLWRANIDIQFVSEDSLALAHYVTGYVTKAEKSHLLDTVWQEIFEGVIFKNFENRQAFLKIFFRNQ